MCSYGGQQRTGDWQPTVWPCPANSTAASTMSRSAPAAHCLPMQASAAHPIVLTALATPASLTSEAQVGVAERHPQRPALGRPACAHHLKKQCRRCKIHRNHRAPNSEQIRCRFYRRLDTSRITGNQRLQRHAAGLCWVAPCNCDRRLSTMSPAGFLDNLPSRWDP